MAIAVEPAAPGKKTSEIAGPISDEETMRMELHNAVCYWNDKEFQKGQQIDAGGVRYECSFGRWVPI